METQAYDLKLRVFARPVHCPHCRRQVDLGALLEPQEILAAAQSLPVVVPGSPAELEALGRKVCERTGVSQGELKGSLREGEYVGARRLFCQLARKRQFSLNQIARYLGCHHTSVMNLLRIKKRPHAQRAARNGHRRCA